MNDGDDAGSGDRPTLSLVRLYPLDDFEGPRKLTRDIFTLGQDGTCDICLQAHSVAECHARIEYEDGSFYILDLGSNFGTYLNEEKVSESVLKPGDLLRIGDFVFKVLKSDGLEAHHYEALYRLTVIDGVTGVYNQRFLLESLNRELARSKRHARSLVFGILDIDHFKKVNDDYGHLTGDETLREIARRVRAVLRADEVFARYGGDEFAVLLEANLLVALTVAGRIMNAVRATPFEICSRNLPVTISMGIAEFSGQQDITPQGLVAAADALLYEAKRAGRNRVVAGKAI